MNNRLADFVETRWSSRGRVQNINGVARMFSGVAVSFRRAREAQEIMNTAESYFESRGTTREKALRRVF